MSTQAIIYARVSAVKDGRARSVPEQVEECRLECDRRGWTVKAVITDEGIGASQHTRRKDRPGFEQLKAELSGADVLVSWESSRVTRTPAVLEELLTLCAAEGVLLCYSGQVLDPSRPSDRMMLRVTGATSALESDMTRERVLRASRHRAAQGRPHGMMPYGYMQQWDSKGNASWVVDPMRAPLVREAARRILDGDSLRSVTADLMARDGYDGPKTGANLRRLLLLPSIAGLRVHRGEVIGEGAWTGLITADEHRRLRALLTAPTRRVTSRGPEARHLLSGNVLECGRCGGRKWSYYESKRSPVPLYRCTGCHLSRRASDLESIVDAAMVSLLNDPRARELMSADDPDTTAATDERQALQQRLDALRMEYVEGAVTAASFAVIEAELSRRIDDVDAAIAAASSRRPLAAAMSGVWADLPIAARKEAVRMTLRVVVNEQAPRLRGVDPKSVDLEWRV